VSIYLHQGGHGGNPPAEQVNRWFSHYLYDVDNGVEKDLPVWIVQDAGAQAPLAVAAAKRYADSVCGQPTTPAARQPTAPRSLPVVVAVVVAAPVGWGAAGAVVRHPPPPTPFATSRCQDQSSWIFTHKRAVPRIGKLAYQAGPAGTEKFIDDVAFSGSANAATGESVHRLLYATSTLTDTVHISGIPRITLRIASSKPAANLSVWLVMLPYDSASVGAQSRTGVIARGWADIQNYKSLTKGGNYESKRAGEPLVPGKFYDLTFDLQPDDEFCSGRQAFGRDDHVERS